jgi:Cu/Ag efflux pump CusA
MISGSRTNLAVKIFGPDLAVLRSLSSKTEEILRQVPRIADVSNQEQATVPQLLVEPDRNALARHDLSPASFSRSVEALFQGTEAGQIAAGGTFSRVVVRFPEVLRADRSRLELLPVTTPGGGMIRLGDVARVRFDVGPGLIRRENVQRLAMVTANITGSDLQGPVDEARRRIGAEMKLPVGYRVVFGGQFEEAGRSLRNLGLLSLFVVGGMYGLLFLAFRNQRYAFIVLVNLPLALIGGILAVAASDRVLSVATLVGFVALFGIATRNGVLLVSHYEHLMQEEGLPLREAVVQGSRERLAPVLMTALTAGLALIPLIVAGQRAGNEIQSPMARVILGGLMTSTFLNLIVVPVLFIGWGDPAHRARVAR